MSLFRSVSLQAKAEQALEQEKIDARISALQDLRFEFCRIIDDLVAREEQANEHKPDELQEL